MISLAELRAYWNSRLIGWSTLVGTAVVATFLTYALATEPPRTSKEVRLAIEFSALFLIIAAITANVVGYAIWRVQALPEGPKRIAYIVMPVTAVGAVIYFYFYDRPYWSHDYFVIAARACTAWVVFLLLALAAAALVRWVGDGFRQG